MKKILDKLDDDIDFLFRRGKRANERCYDFFIRTITFFVVALIVLCYASFVHADDGASNEMITLVDAGIESEVFVDSQLNEWLSLKGYTSSDFSTVGIVSGLSSYPFSVESLSGLLIPSYITYGDNTYYPEDYHIFLGRGNFSSGGINYLNVYIVVGQDIIVGNGGTTVYSFSSENFGVFKCAVNPSTLVPYSGYPYYNSENHNVRSDSNGFDTNITYTYYNIPSPIYYGNKEIYTILLDDTLDSNIRTDFTYQYVHYPDNIFQINYKYALANPEEPEPETENNSNHMYFQNVKMGLTAQGENNNLSSSSLVVGCEVDDYIKNHMSEYKVYISCEVHYKDSVYTKNSTYGELLPLSLFYNQAYVKGLSELFSNMPWDSPYANFYSYYRHLGDDYNVFTKNVSGKNGTLNIPTLIDILKFTSGFYKLDTSTSHVPNDFSISTFQLDVSVVVTDSDTFDTKSGVFTQRFDFLNGNTSILKADALVNENPWQGVSEPTANPFPNGSAGGSSNGSVVQNNNQTVNVNIDNGFSFVNGGADGEDYDNTIDNIRNLLGEFKNGIGVISEASVNSETGQPNGFLGLLESTYSFIPGMNYFVIAIAIICALAVILFIIKVLLF